MNINWRWFIAGKITYKPVSIYLYTYRRFSVFPMISMAIFFPGYDLVDSQNYGARWAEPRKEALIEAGPRHIFLGTFSIPRNE